MERTRLSLNEMMATAGGRRAHPILRLLPLALAPSILTYSEPPRRRRKPPGVI